MAVNDVLYHIAERRPLQDVLTAIRLNMPVAEAGFELEQECRAPSEAAGRDGAAVPPPSRSARRDAALCRKAGFSLTDLKYNYPDEPTESGLEPQAELERLTWEGARRRYPDGIPEKVAEAHPA